MSPSHRDVTSAELAVLRLLWRDEESNTRELAAELYSGGTNSDYATVQKLLARLEKKGFVAKRRQGATSLFRAVIGRDELIDRRLQETAETLCDGSLTPLLTQLVRPDKLSKTDRDALRALIDGLDDKGTKGAS